MSILELKREFVITTDAMEEVLRAIQNRLVTITGVRSKYLPTTEELGAHPQFLPWLESRLYEVFARVADDVAHYIDFPQDTIATSFASLIEQAKARQRAAHPATLTVSADDLIRAKELLREHDISVE